MADKRDILKDIYYDINHPASYGSMKLLYKAAKKLRKDITMQDVRSFFQRETIPSRFANARRNFPRAIFTAGSAYSVLTGDMADMTTELARYNNKNRYINVVCDLFSRLIIGLTAQVTKSSAETAGNLDKIFAEVKDRKVRVFLTDQGTEYLGKSLAVYMKYGIEHQQTVGVEQKVQTVERSIQNIKRMLYKLMDRHGTKRWVDFLDAVKDHQNRKYHRVLRMSPLEAAKTENQSQVFRNTVTRREMKNFASLAKQKRPVFKFDIGDHVRIIRYESYQKTFKGVWSNAVYRIVSRKLKNYIPTYELEDLLTGEEIHGTWYEPELRSVDLEEHQLPKVQKVYGRRLNENTEEVQVQLEGSKARKWIPVQSLIPYKQV